MNTGKTKQKGRPKIKQKPRPKPRGKAAPKPRPKAAPKARSTAASKPRGKAAPKPRPKPTIMIRPKPMPRAGRGSAHAGHGISAVRHDAPVWKRRPKRPIRTEPSDPTRQRLQKVLASAGVDSRRNCEQLILDGNVTVNGIVVDKLPVFVDPKVDVIAIDGKRISRPKKVYYLLNKPTHVICTNSDPLGRRRAIDLIDSSARIFCVGRLDADTTGAIILTNDSELTNRLTHPRYELPKTYEVRIKGRVDGAGIEKLKKGIWLAEGRTLPAVIKVLKRNNAGTTLQVIIRQGLNRQIRRVIARIGYRVKALKRSRIGDISIKGVPLGGYKTLSKGQIEYLKKQTVT